MAPREARGPQPRAAGEPRAKLALDVQRALARRGRTLGTTRDGMRAGIAARCHVSLDKPRVSRKLRAMRRADWLVLAIALAMSAPGIGCSSISDSSRSVSKSVSSPSDSSSEKHEDIIYKGKIRDYSYGYAKAGGDPQAFARGIGALAQRRGIHDWEQDESTCRAIGEGFRDAGAGKSASHASIAQIVAPKSECGAWMRAGYHER